METVKLMISPEQEELFLKQFYQIATKAIEKAEENAGITRDYLNQKEMAEYLNVSENFLKSAVRNEGLPVTTLGARKFYSKKAVNEFMLARMKSGENIERWGNSTVDNVRNRNIFILWFNAKRICWKRDKKCSEENKKECSQKFEDWGNTQMEQIDISIYSYFNTKKCMEK